MNNRNSGKTQPIPVSPAMLLLTISLILLFSVNFSAGEECPESWKKIKDTEMCIKLFEYKVSWWTARKSCESFQGGHLAILNSDKLRRENFFEKADLTEKVKHFPPSSEFSSHEYIWIGLAQLCPEDENTDFKWLDGQAADKTKDPVTQFGGADKFCVGLNTKSAQLRSFQCDGGPQGGKMFVCQKILGKAETKDPDGYPIGFCKGDSGNYYSVTPFKATWHTAEAYCKSQGANLISIADKKENEELRKYATKMNTDYHWIGLNSPMGHKFKWSDSSPLNYVVWTSDATVQLNESCVAADHTSEHTVWKMMPCDEKTEGICVIAKKTEKSKTEASKSNGKFCKEGWERYLEWCYQITKDDQDTKEIPNSCPEGSIPAAIRDAYHEESLLGILEGQDAWFDLRQARENGSRYYHRHGKDEKIAYSNVDELYKCPSTNEFCPFFLTTVGWRAEAHNERKYKTICEMRPTEEKEHKAVNKDCANGTSFKSSCYVLNPNMSSWEKANKTGCGKNGTLVLLNDDAEWSFVSSFVHKNWIRSFWIGRQFDPEAKDKADYMKKTEFNQQIQKNRNNPHPLCHEMELGEGGPRVVLADCRGQLPFVCKYPSATGAKTTTTTTSPDSSGGKGKTTKKQGTTVKPPTENPTNNGTEAGQSAGGSNATLKNAVIAMSVLLVLGLVIGVVCWLRRRRRPRYRMEVPFGPPDPDEPDDVQDLDFDRSIS